MLSDLDVPQPELLELASGVRSSLGEAAVMLAGLDDGAVSLVGAFSQAAIDRGLSAAAVLREVAPIVGGGGGGRDDIARAGGKDPGKLDDAIAAARTSIESGLGNS